MNPMTAPVAPSLGRPAPASSRTSRWPAAARTIHGLLQRLQVGGLTVHWPDGTVQTCGFVGRDGLQATLVLHDWVPCQAALRSGDVGFAQAYVDGHWSSPDLPSLLTVLARNRQAVESALYGHWLGQLVYRIRHRMRRNTRANSRRNIHAHYDLGNDFYALWLDASMNYSGAWFDGDPQRPLHDAQAAKVRRALHEAGVKPGDRVLEIGCGWGALAETAVKEFGAHVTGVTLSTEQLAFARERLQGAGGPDRADLRLQDYRDIADGPYDAVCSIEMIEAVGREYWPTYFRAVRQLLKPGGRACIQSIVIDDRLFDRYLRSTDFIQQAIFPGGCLPSPTAFSRAAEAAGLVVERTFEFGADYARTCALWRETFLARREAVRALGYDEPFLRTWEFYLAYCEAGFRAGDVGLVQFTLRRD